MGHIETVVELVIHDVTHPGCRIKQSATQFVRYLGVDVVTQKFSVFVTEIEPLLIGVVCLVHHHQPLNVVIAGSPRLDLSYSVRHPAIISSVFIDRMCRVQGRGIHDGFVFVDSWLPEIHSILNGDDPVFRNGNKPHLIGCRFP